MDPQFHDISGITVLTMCHAKIGWLIISTAYKWM